MSARACHDDRTPGGRVTTAPLPVSHWRPRQGCRPCRANAPCPLSATRRAGRRCRAARTRAAKPRPLQRHRGRPIRTIRACGSITLRPRRSPWVRQGGSWGGNLPSIATAATTTTVARRQRSLSRQRPNRTDGVLGICGSLAFLSCIDLRLFCL